MVWLKLREEEQPRLFVLLFDELHTAIRDEVDAVLILEAYVLSLAKISICDLALRMRIS